MQKYILIQFHPCNDNLTRCASQEKISSFLETHSVVIYGKTSFIDLNEVNKNENPLQSGIEMKMRASLKLFQTYSLDLIEHQVSLEDSLFQLIGSKANEFSYLDMQTSAK